MTTPAPTEPESETGIETAAGPTSLITAARQAALNSYSPYSNFAVGAAVLCTDGTVIEGCNVENASYGLTICAERNALFAAVALGHRQMPAIAVTCPDGDKASPNTLMPCGACRQVIVELLADDGVVIVDHVGVFTKTDLLPLAFVLD
jgi:cytidine deaminase